MAGINLNSEITNVQQNISNLEDDIFAEAERSLDMKIPTSLKNLLKASGFENEIIMANMNDSDIQNILLFARKDLHKLIEKEDLPNYYGLYWKNPSVFEIMPGHKLMLSKPKEKQIKRTEQKNQILHEVNLNQPSTSQLLSPINDEVTDDNLLASSEASRLEESLRVRKIITSWAQGKVTKDRWKTLKDPLYDILINIHASELNCSIKCFCGSTYNISKFSKGGSKSKRWIYSNFQVHLLKKHIESSSATKFVNKKNYITNYMSSSSTEISNAKINDNIEYANTEANTENIEKIQRTSNNEEKTEMMNLVEVIDRAEIIFDDVVNVITTDEKAENKVIPEVIPLQEVTEKYDTDANCSNSNVSNEVSNVIDLNLNVNSNKWKSMKYQRSKRLKRAREKLNLDQKLITHYFTLAEKISQILFDNSDITKNFLPRITNLQSQLIKGNNKLVTRNTNRNSYNDATKKFSIYLYYVGGRLLYETLHSNLPNALSSISTLNRYSYNIRKYTEEGKIDFEGLVQHLKERNASKVIWIAEDATRITGKIEYDSRPNKILRFVLPLKNVKLHMQYVIMAQSLSCNVPAYCLSLFSTDNKFNAKNVLDRWTYLKKEAKKFGIIIAGFSSDGDTRLLKAMRLNNYLPIESNQVSLHNKTWPWFQINMNNVEECYIQDTTHIITKMRTRFLKEGIMLQMGNHLATVEHLHYLVKTVLKDKHLLTSWDLKGEDKINFSAGEKMCSSLVTNYLKQIPNTNGTITYLTIMNYIILSFLDESTPLRARIYYLWYVVFFLRIWRAWIKRNKQYTLKDSFLTNNCYLCIELNAHNLIKLITKFKDSEQSLTPEMFRSVIFSSQMCEKLFRTVRSMTSTYSTVINFSIKDLINRIDKIRQINSIMNDLQEIFKFSREDKKKLKCSNTLNVITCKDIEDLNITEIVEEALKNAIKSTEELGIEVTSDTDWKLVDIPLQTLDDDCKFEDGITNTEDVDICISNSDLFDDPNDIRSKNLELKDFSEKVSKSSITENSLFIEIEINNKIIVVKKFSYCWFLDEGNGKISTDRLRRFMTVSSSPEKNENGLEKECFLENIPEIYNKNDVPKIFLEKYYAVFYDDKYYIGRVVDQCNNHVKIKFLKSEFNSFVWPRDEDITFIDAKYIFYGPIELVVTGPFVLKHYDAEPIHKKYKITKHSNF
ncbi:hypothetical protein PUN28_019401 [Cardiocondyla obscurior]|uniref:Uncharacterized protein n=1 Tax=Cardiocondyla obscurior TaxID=286306 RepID=A0AAW2EFL9_9HYME